jgi:carboxylesterase type B
MVPTIAHLSLNANLKGTEVGSDQTTAVHHYRGIRYATIPQRFAKAEPIDDWHGAELDCSRFG